MMQLQVKFNTTVHEITVTETATVQNLKDEVFRATKIEQSRQKLVFRGKTLNENHETLSSLNITNGAKLMLIASPEKEKIVETRRESTLFPGMRFQRRSAPFSLDANIVSLGAPEGALPYYAAQTLSLPKKPFVVRTSIGLAELWIETEAFVVRKNGGENGSTQRFFFNELARGELISIGDRKYFALCIESNQGDREMLYFIPSQFRDVIHNIAQSESA